MTDADLDRLLVIVEQHVAAQLAPLTTEIDNGDLRLQAVHQRADTSEARLRQLESTHKAMS